jgi:hypothetical protein
MNLFIMMVVSCGVIPFILRFTSDESSVDCCNNHPTIYMCYRIFGGLAGITALSQKEQDVHVISVWLCNRFDASFVYCWIWIGYLAVSFFLGRFVSVLHQCFLLLCHLLDDTFIEVP